jgi:hypothetical protein
MKKSPQTQPSQAKSKPSQAKPILMPKPSYHQAKSSYRQVLFYAGNVLHRYMVDGVRNASYTDGEMFLAS